MLYIIGGAARAGKSILARRLLVERHIPNFSVDYLVSVFQHGLPQLGISHDQSSAVKAEKVWPFLEPLAVNVVEEEPEYVIEGDGLLPGPVAAFCRQHPGRVRPCFLGYPQADPEVKLRAIRTYGRGPNNWVRNLTDAEVLDLIDKMISFSRQLERACAEHQVAFFDTSRDFATALDAAWRHLSGGS